MPWAERVYALSQPESSQLNYEMDRAPRGRIVARQKNDEPDQPRVDATITSVALVNPRTEQFVGSCRFGDEVTLRVRITSPFRIIGGSVSFRVRDESGRPVFGTTTFDEGHDLPQNWEKGLVVDFVFSAQVMPGNYVFDVAVNNVSERDYSDNVLLHQLDEAATLAVLRSADRPVRTIRFTCPSICTHRVVKSEPAERVRL